MSSQIAPITLADLQRPIRARLESVPQELRRIEDYPHHVAIGAAVSLTDAYAALVAQRPSLKTFADRYHKPLWVAELGVRSAAHAYAKPWESPEERAAWIQKRREERAKRGGESGSN